MVYMASQIDGMPRGGPDASCLDRLLQTDRPEYLDRDDVHDRTKRSVIRALEWTGEFFGNTERFARIVLDEVAEHDPDAEIEAARAAVRRKLRSMRALDPEVATRRLVGMLGRKGHSPGVAFRVVREELDATDG